MDGLEVASLGRFELPTYRLGGGCSVHLSYRDPEISGTSVTVWR